MGTGRRVLLAVWIAIVGWRLRKFWQWKADSEDNECSCFDVTPIDGTECWGFMTLTADTILDNKSYY
jgi:hypothetical protein